MWRRLLAVVGALTAAVTAVGAAVHSGAAARFAQQHLHALVLRELHQDLQVDALQLELLPPGVVLFGASLRRDGAALPYFSCRRLRVRPHPWPSPTGALVIGAVELDGLRVHQALTPRPPPGARSPPAAVHAWQAPRLPLDVRQAHVADAEVVFEDGTRRLALAQVALDMEVTAVHGRHIVLDVPVGEVLWPQLAGAHAQPFTLTASVGLDGTLHRPQALHVTSAQGTLGQLAMAVSGQLELAPTAVADLDVALQGDLTALPPLWPQLPPLAGDVRIEAHLRGTSLDPSATLAVHSDGIGVPGRRLGAVTLQADINRQRAVVGALQLTPEHEPGTDAGTLTGSGRVAFGPGAATELTARLHDASLPHVLAAFGVPHAWVRMRAAGDVQARGSLRPLRLELQSDLACRDFAALDRGYTQPQARSLLAVGRSAVRGSFVLEGRHAALREVSVHSGTSEVRVRGQVGLGVGAHLDLEVTGDAVDLADLGPLAGVALAGRGPLRAALSGPVHRPTVAADITLADAAIDATPLGDGSAHLRFTMPELTATALHFRRHGGAVAGAGRLLLGGPRIAVLAELQLDAVQADDVLEAVGVPQDLAHHLAGPMDGAVQLAGPLALPRGTLQLRSTELRVDGVELGPVHLDGSFGAPGLPFSAELHLAPASGRLAVAVALASDGSLRLHADATRVPLVHLTPLLGEAQLTGLLSGTLALRGPPRALDGEAQLRVAALRAWDVALEEAVLDAEARAGQARLHGTVLGGDAAFTADVRLGGSLPFAAQVRFSQLDAGRLTAALGPDVGATASGELAGTGALADARGLRAQLTLASAELRWRGLTLRSTHPTVLRYAAGGLRLDEAHLSGARLQLRVLGQLLDGGALPLDVALAITGDLGAVAEAVAPVSAARLPFELELGIGGSWRRPTLAGHATLARGSLRAGGSEERVDQIAATLRCAGPRVELGDGQARIGRGSLQLSGEALFAPAASGPFDPELALRAHLAGVELRPSPDLEATLSGDAQLTGLLSALTLRGRLHVDSLRYTARLELERLLQRRPNVPLRARGGRGAPVALALRLQAQNNLIVASNVLEAELQADVTLTGNSERIGMLGTVVPLWARARYRDNTFTVLRASADFTDEYRIFPEFQLQARTEACRMTADVTLQGNPENYTVTTYGQDAHGVVDAQDVLACLQFGLRLQDFAGNQHAAAGIGDALPGGLDALWTVSGLDDKVKRLLPIEVSELRLTSGWSQLSQRTTARVQVGKDLTKQVALRYSRSLDEYNDQALSIEYKLGERAIAQGSWLSVRDVPVGDFGVDLRLHWEMP